MPEKRAVKRSSEIETEMDQNKKVTSTAAIFWNVKTATSASRINRQTTLKVGIWFPVWFMFNGLRQF